MTFCWEHGAFAAACGLAGLFAMMWRCERCRRISMERRVEAKLDQILRAEADARPTPALPSGGGDGEGRPVSRPRVSGG